MVTEVKPEEKPDGPAEGIVLDVPSAHQRYLDSLLGEDHEPPERFPTSGPEGLTTPTKEGYVATDPIYQNHANSTEKPLAAKDGADALAEKAYKEAVTGKGKPAGKQLSDLYGDITKNSP
jgi:hypothetical protein